MSVNIRSIQHYMYCPRRYGLITINTDWAENAFVARGELVHKRVDDKSHAGKSPNKVFASSVAVYNDDLDIYGILDCAEFEKSKNGVEISGLEGKYKVKIIEYKPTRPKNGEIRPTDAIQVFAQKVCGDYVWNCDCECYIYYADVRRRVRLPFDTEYEKYNSMLNDLLRGMNRVAQSGIIPPKPLKQNCSGCSMSDLCMPKTQKYSVKNLILEGSGI